MSTRYQDLFQNLETRGEGAFVPFLMLGDPSPEETLEIVRTVVRAGADALELGVPFSDPVADGPTIQESHLRALSRGASVDNALRLVSAIREEFPELPLGMLIYGNVAFTRGLENFYSDFAAAGADSILLPDVPARESAPFRAAARDAGIHPIFIAPAQARAETLEAVAKASEGYIYAISRDGVTGTESASQTAGLQDVVANVRRFGGPPVLLGFGISEPEHVSAAIAAGAAGAITGSAITRIIGKHLRPDPASEGAAVVANKEQLHTELSDYVARMKAATTRQ